LAPIALAAWDIVFVGQYGTREGGGTSACTHPLRWRTSTSGASCLCKGSKGFILRVWRLEQLSEWAQLHQPARSHGEPQMVFGCQVRMQADLSAHIHLCDIS
jgi:hypothetical protein